MAINVLIVDDEPHIRMILRKVIEKKAGFEVIGECDNMADALIIFNQHRPEVVFMDIEINGSSGIDCARVISQLNSKTKIIFATAHSEYMSNAFELYAFDYLVKPFDIERIMHTLERIENEKNAEEQMLRMNQTEQTKTGNEDNSMNQQTVTPKNQTENVHEDTHEKLMIKGKESMSFVDLKELILIERENNSTVLYTASGESYRTSMSMGELEKRLDPDLFMRSHKSYIINISKIKSVEPYGRWTYIVKLKGIEQDALLTKEKFELIRQMFS